ncbi:hypothetical protein [Sulfobacillus thermosulfidooxidans]|uniref:hypothetical protein n=1 Tax=Sulfobacillus thermosulfidooxidans TaxID=28034 RepID=UPI00096BB091|nr:hypothetical protein [Sulfobacillus thermosulfidooxidans]OLZ11933.1 hypothetical protein BFX05_05505 [Sulfobacillus thermosulfidooxidans]OLZ17616.1 hypothetical protein BFX06_12750 [Sulfobacillus thermosulfidooxidans]OLZ22397.1 hypothetical protein BFX07_00120 [Sulfobacillus thermosulfidooxidans]
MDWQVFRDAKESELAEHRAFVEQTLQWRVPGFHWSAASVKQWYEERSQWPEEIQRAVEFLYQYDYPLRVLEEQIVHDESWLWNDYDGMRQKLMETENRFWQNTAASAAKPDADESQSQDLSMLEWWQSVRGRRGPLLAVLRSKLPLEKYLQHLSVIAQSNDYEAAAHIDDADHASLDLIPKRFVDLLRDVNPDVMRLLPLHMDLSREQGRLSVTLTDWIGESTWPENPSEDVLKALAWFDVTGTIFLDSLGWVR